MVNLSFGSKKPSVSGPLRDKLLKEFDPTYYRREYPDVPGSDLDLFSHFMKVGWTEGRNPNRGFSTRFYLEQYEDVRRAGLNPYYHYWVFGRGEGRFPHPSALNGSGGDSDVRDVVVTEFDPNFYRQTYSDMRGGDAELLDHFLKHGWREGRNPNANFDTTFYLGQNQDVREAGLNAFYHYLKYGRQEGRRAVPPLMTSAIPTPDCRDTEAEGSDAVALRLGVISMVKNEADIIETYVEHLLKLFDEIVIVDHGSADGTLEFLESAQKKHPAITLYRLEEQGYIQALVMNTLVKECAQLRDMDWLFLLDADEFLPFASKKELHASFARYAKSPVVAMYWKNLVPASLSEYAFDPNSEFLVPPYTSPFHKIAFQPKKLSDERYWIEQGNHAIARWQGGPLLQHTDANFPIWHIPVRSADQLSLKLNQGVMSYLSIGATRERVEGLHWFTLLNEIGGADLSKDILNSVIHFYGQQSQKVSPTSDNQLLQQGYTRAPISIAREPIGERVKRPRSIGSLFFKVNGGFASRLDADTHPQDRVPTTKLEITRRNVIRRAKDDSGHKFSRLPEPDDGDAIFDLGKASDHDVIRSFLRPSYWSIDDLTPTAWGGHIPFMFSFVNAFRPRRYVELGSHYGASFFAYCQAAKRCFLETSAVAIDTWKGDDHTGGYDESVFNQFQYLLRKYDGFASYLRMYFDKAAPLFAESSIDLLLIDGLHTYEAVTHDFRTWLPKMSSRGVIFLHDINVHERDFGVWELWAELKKTYPTIEFRHSHGLGVAYVGTWKSTKIERLFKILNGDSALNSMFQHHFEATSEKSVELFLSRFQLKEGQERVKAHAKLNEELSVARQKLASVTAERDQMKQMVQGIGLKWRERPKN
jgi:hypothetical protein